MKTTLTSNFFRKQKYLIGLIIFLFLSFTITCIYYLITKNGTGNNNYFSLINNAGKQRMLSQKLAVKLVMLKEFENNKLMYNQKLQDVKNIYVTLDSVNIYVSKHFEKFLLKSNEILRKDIRDVNQNLISIKILLDSLPTYQSVQLVKNIVLNTDSFLSSMERVVDFIEIEANSKESSLVKMLLINLGVLLLLFFYFLLLFIIFLKKKMLLRKKNLDELESTKLYVPNNSKFL